MSVLLGLLLAVAGASGGELTLSQLAARYQRTVPLDEACRLDPQDPYDPGVRAAGDHRHLCADTSWSRVPHFIREDHDSVTIANFRYQERWWIAQIPKRGIERVFYQSAFLRTGIEGFVGAAHGQLRFMFSHQSPVILRSQSRGSDVRTVLTDIIFDPRPFGARGVEADLWGPVRGRVLMTGAFVATAERGLHYSALDNASRIEQAELNLRDWHRERLLEGALRHSLRWGYQNVYHALTNNCVTLVFHVIDEALFPGHQFPPPVINVARAVVVRDALIGPVRSWLQMRGLVGPGGWTDFDKETDRGRTLIHPRLVRELYRRNETPERLRQIRSLFESVCRTANHTDCDAPLVAW